MNVVTPGKLELERAVHSLPLETMDVADPKLYQDDTWQPYFERLRREDPVHRVPSSRWGPYWAVTKYKDIMHCEVHPEVFSSERGGIVLQDLPDDLQRPSFIRMDPPKHTRQRRVVSPIMAPSNLLTMEELIRERTRIVLDELPRNETFDWVEHVSIKLTTMMLATLFDFPYADRDKLTYWSDVSTVDVNDPASPVKTEEAKFAELKLMAEYMGRLFDERRRQPPRSDLLSMLAHGEATREMELREFMGNLTLLIVGGNDTTRNSMSGGLLALNQFPDQYRKLLANPALVESLVPEIIRFVSPVIYMRRTTTRDTELGGKTIPAGAKVAMWYVSGNRDPDAIDDPDSFVVDRRRPRQHLSFGYGIHRCVGDRLAELQLKILWEEILRRFPAIEVVGEPKRAYSSFLRGIRSMPVRIPG